LRKDSTATVLNVNETSVVVTDNDYIFVTNDTPVARKNALLNSANTLFMDFDIAFREPPPLIKGLQTVYAAVIDSDGNADVETFTPVGIPVTSDAVISSYAWDADGGSFQVGGAGTQSVQLRYTTPGFYRPRVTVTDDNALTSWFSPYVFVIPNDFSSVVSLGFDGISLSCTIEDGWNATVNAFEGAQNLLDNTLVATYEPGDHVQVTSDITFVGRLRNEQNAGAMSQQHGLDPKVSFEIEGIGTQMGRLISRPITYSDKASPTKFTHINNCTPWRAIGEFVREFTNINNTHSLEFDDVSNDFQFKSYSTGATSTLDSITNILFTQKAAIEWAASGEMKIARHANWLPTADRNALTTIANFTLVDDYATESGDGVLYDLPIDYVRNVGKNIVYGGSYNTTNGSITSLKSTTPAVTQSDGPEKSETNRQVLKANLSGANAAVELGQRGGDDFAAKQLNEVLTVTYPDSYRWFQPSVSSWFTHTINRDENLRGIAYTTSTRWLTSAVDIVYDIQLHRRVVRVTHPIETSDPGFATTVEEPPDPVAYTVPVQPVLDAFPGFLPETFGSDLPSGAVDEDEQPVTAEDLAPQSEATDPQVVIDITYKSSGNTIMVWNDSELWRCDDIGVLGTATWQNTLITATGTIEDAIWDDRATIGAPAFAVSNDGTDSYIYTTNNLGEAKWFEPGDTIETWEGSQIRQYGGDSFIAYGIAGQYLGGATFTLDLLNGNGQGTLRGSSLDPTHSGTVSSYPGEYTGADVFRGGDGDNGGRAVNIEWPIPPGVVITDVLFKVYFDNNDIGDSGERRCTIEIFEDGSSVHRTDQDLAYATTANVTVQIPGVIGKAGDILLMHAAVEDDTSGAIRIYEVQIKGNATADYAATTFTTDRAANMSDLTPVEEMSLGDGSFDIRQGTKVMAASNQWVRESVAGTDTYANETDGDAGAGNYAAAIWGLGTGTNDYLYATDAGVLYIVLSG
ncbi:MAG: PKD domain-containing protein, partial [Planctomycetota bacterium]